MFSICVYKPAKMEEELNVISIDVSGTKFTVERDLLRKFPLTRLGKIVSEQGYDSENSEKKCISFQRSASSFESVLIFYQTGKLHIPRQICPKAFKTELDFWEIDISRLEMCCLHNYLTFKSNEEIMDTFQAYEKATSEDHNKSMDDSQMNRLRKKIWSVIGNRENSTYAKVYHCTTVLFVLMSIFSIALSTLPAFQNVPGSCHGREDFLGKYRSSVLKVMVDFISRLPCDDTTNDAFGDYIDYWDNYYGLAENESVSDQFSDFLNKLKLPSRIQQPLVFTCMEYIGTGFFTIELILRLLTCPSYKKFFLSVLNILEIIVLLAAYAYIIIDDFVIKYRLAIKEIEVLQYMQMLRAFRLFRVIQNVTAIKVLGYSLKHRYNDILVLVMFMFVGVLVFANIMYFVENSVDFPSIPDAWWWCVITMTTVGYGDMTPKTAIGKIIGSLCALSGIVLLSLVIPIFANTYMSLYQFANLESENKTSKKENNRKETQCI